jgi:hypothetical protein
MLRTGVDPASQSGFAYYEHRGLDVYFTLERQASPEPDGSEYFLRWLDENDGMSVPLLLTEFGAKAMFKKNPVPSPLTIGYLLEKPKSEDKKAAAAAYKAVSAVLTDRAWLRRQIEREHAAWVERLLRLRLPKPAAAPVAPPPKPKPKPRNVIPITISSDDDDDDDDTANDAAIAAAISAPDVSTFDHEVDVQFTTRFDPEYDAGSYPTNKNANEYIWFFDLEVHNGWPARAICQLTAVRADHAAFVDEYVFHALLHRSYQDVMTFARGVLTMKDNAAAVGAIKRIQLSPWDDPEVAKPLHEVMLLWLDKMHDNSIVVYMGTTDPGVIMLNLYEQCGLATTEGILRLMKQKGFWAAKYLDIRKYCKCYWEGNEVKVDLRNKQNNIAPPGGLSKVHRALFIDTLDRAYSRVEDFDAMVFDDCYTNHDWRTADGFIEDDGKRLQIEYHQRIPIWHTAHTDSIILKNIVCALLFSIYCWDKTKDEDRTDEADGFSKRTMQYIMMKTRGFKTHGIKLPAPVAASLYAFLRFNIFLRPDAPTGTVPLTPKHPAKAVAFYMCNKATKGSPYIDFKKKYLHIKETDDESHARLVLNFDGGYVDDATSSNFLKKVNTRANARAGKNNKGVVVSLTSDTKLISSSKKRLDQRLQLVQIMKDIGREDEWQAFRDAKRPAVDFTLPVLDWMKDTDPTLAADEELMLDWPIYYLPSTATSKKNSVVLHNRYCHLLHDIDDQLRAENLFFRRYKKLDQTLVGYYPDDQLFTKWTPVFCKQCKRYVNDVDPAVPVLIGMRNSVDEWSRKLPAKWSEQAPAASGPRGTDLIPYKLSMRLEDVPKTASETSDVTAEIVRTRPRSNEDEDRDDEAAIWVLADEEMAVPADVMPIPILPVLSQGSGAIEVQKKPVGTFARYSSFWDML